MSGIRSHPNPLLAGWRLPDGVERPTAWYQAIRRFLQTGVCSMWQVRVFNRHYEPASGGVVYVSNHQSFLDPILMSFSLRRPVSYMARDSLFRSRLFGPTIASVNAFPVKRGSADTGALKEAMRRIKAGGQVVLFAEGTRTRDGRISALLPGLVMLAQRVAEWTVPVAIDGAFESWPRRSLLPTPGNIVVQYAKPIHKSEAKRLAPAELTGQIRRTLIDMQTDIRQRVGRSPIRYE